MVVDPSANHFDVVIVGAGISGINFGYRLQEQNPELKYTILDAREAIGGTWDLFKYPGIRSDSDLYTFGFPWRPWTEQKSIAEGPLIVNYVKESAAMYGIDKKIQFNHKVSAANWSSDRQHWSLSVSANGAPKTVTGRFMLLCTGYYDYEKPLTAIIPGIENFQGNVIHPQFWPTDLNYTDKKVVIIGSGATAITLLPALAEEASNVIMLQRSPSFILSQPKEDAIEVFIRKTCPVWLQHKLIRFKWLILPFIFINFCRYLPNTARKLFRKGTTALLPPGMAHDPHFNPKYNPFEQRVCFCPDGDFYAALRNGKANIVTDTISQVTEKSIKLTSGQELNPDIIVTATGLRIRVAGGIDVTVDKAPINVSDKFLWKSCMLQDLPNCAFVLGYVDASWTLGADATSNLMCRLLNKMKKEGNGVAIPRLSAGEKAGMKEVPVLNLTSTYVKAGKSALPKAGDATQWRARSSYFRDWWESRFGNLTGGMEFIRAL